WHHCIATAHDRLSYKVFMLEFYYTILTSLTSCIQDTFETPTIADSKCPQHLRVCERLNLLHSLLYNNLMQDRIDIIVFVPLFFRFLFCKRKLNSLVNDTSQ